MWNVSLLMQFLSNHLETWKLQIKNSLSNLNLPDKIFNRLDLITDQNLYDFFKYINELEVNKGPKTRLQIQKEDMAEIITYDKILHDIFMMMRMMIKLFTSIWRWRKIIVCILNLLNKYWLSIFVFFSYHFNCFRFKNKNKVVDVIGWEPSCN